MSKLTIGDVILRRLVAAGVAPEETYAAHVRMSCDEPGDLVLYIRCTEEHLKILAGDMEHD